MILSVKNVSKSYGAKRVLKGVNLEVPPGQLVGLLGPNGSGKTTLIKLISHMITQYSGEITVCGEEIGAKSKALVSCLPDGEFLPEDMKLASVVQMYRDFFVDFDHAKANEMLKAMRLEPNARYRQLSKGMKEKLGLLLTLSRKAKLYVFDEPIAGVDPAARDYILQTIIKNFSPESSLLFSTHLIGDVEAVLDRVLFLKDGVIVRDGIAEEIRQTTGKSIDALFREEFRETILADYI